MTERQVLVDNRPVPFASSPLVSRQYVAVKRADRKDLRLAVAIPIESKRVAVLAFINALRFPSRISRRRQRQKEQTFHGRNEISRSPRPAEQRKIETVVFRQT